MNLQDAMADIRVGKLGGIIESWLRSLDNEKDRELANELLYARQPLRPDRYLYTNDAVASTLAKVGVEVDPTTVRNHRKRTQNREG